MEKNNTKTGKRRRGLDYLTAPPQDAQIFFTADTHFNHESILRYCKRPFLNLPEMNETIIENWNSRVRKHDSIYIIGDFAFGSPMDAADILDRLNGQKFLIRGNHDSVAKHRLCRDKFVWIKSYHVITPRMGEIKQPIILFHYAQRVWDRMHHGSWQLHGHSHGTLWSQGNLTIDVGVDCWDFYPVHLHEVYLEMKGRTFTAVDHHDEGVN